MYKIINSQLIKRLAIYFIGCLILGFAFQYYSSINEIFRFFELRPLKTGIDFIILCSRLSMPLAIVVFLVQDYIDFFGSKYTFIQIRTDGNRKYYNYILCKEFISLILFSFVYLASLLMTMQFSDSLNLRLFIIHDLSFIFWLWNIFLAGAILYTLFSERAFICLLFGIVFLYMFLFSIGSDLKILLYLNLNQSWLFGQVLISICFIQVLYQIQQIRR